MMGFDTVLEAVQESRRYKFLLSVSLYAHAGKYWKNREIMCPCCGLIIMKPRLINAMDALREYCGYALVANSWTRCRPHNKWVGGAMFSRHLKGEAVDVRPLKGPMDDRFINACNCFPYCKVYKEKNYCHVDIRGWY